MSKPQALLLGSSYSALPILQSLKRADIEVTVCGSDANEPCQLMADKSCLLDYSKPELILDHCKKNSYQYIVPSCNDYAYNTASFIAELLVFPGFDNHQTTLLLHTKDLLRSFLIEHNLPSPAVFNHDSALDFLDKGGSVLVKPVDSFSGKGIIHVQDKNLLETAIHTASEHSSSGSVVLEQFVYGRLVSHSAFILNNLVSIDFFVDEFCTTYDYQVDCSCHPSSIPKEMMLAIRKAINLLVKLMNLKDGLLHTQIIIEGNSFYIIECMRRAPGDLYGHLIQKSTTFDYWLCYIKPFIAGNFQYSESFTRTNYSRPVLRHTISTMNSTTFKSFTLYKNNINTEVFPLKESGFFLEQAPYDKAAIIFSECVDLYALHEITSNYGSQVSLNSYH